MKLLKDNPILLIWLLALTALVIFSLFYVKVTVHVQAPQEAQVAIRSSYSILGFGENK